MSRKFMDPFDSNPTNNYLKYTDVNGVQRSFTIGGLQATLAANNIFSMNKIRCYDQICRHGYIPLFETEQISKEYLFFTKPDLHLFGDASGKYFDYNCDLNSELAIIPYFRDANFRTGDAMRQLQYSVRDSRGQLNPFMYLLTNCVKSKLDLPGISAESRESTSNIMGTTIQYRSHSYKSDNGYDFTLSFTDTAYLEIYTMLKVYDEYMRLVKTGEVTPIRKYIINRIIPEQFSIYKFLVNEDGETISYYAKLTGCYFTDVPRSDMSDPGNDGFKYSVSFHAQFVEDSNPMILEEFNRLTPGRTSSNYANVYDKENNVVDNTWVRWPKIVSVNDDRTSRRGTTKDYRIKWIK